MERKIIKIWISNKREHIHFKRLNYLFNMSNVNYIRNSSEIFYGCGSKCLSSKTVLIHYLSNNHLYQYHFLRFTQELTLFIYIFHCSYFWYVHLCKQRQTLFHLSLTLLSMICSVTLFLCILSDP